MNDWEIVKMKMFKIRTLLFYKNHDLSKLLTFLENQEFINFKDCGGCISLIINYYSMMWQNGVPEIQMVLMCFEIGPGDCDFIMVIEVCF